jgi:hypothetical protein
LKGFAFTKKNLPILREKSLANFLDLTALQPLQEEAA